MIDKVNVYQSSWFKDTLPQGAYLVTKSLMIRDNDTRIKE